MHCKVHFYQPELTVTTIAPSAVIENSSVSDITKIFQGAAVKAGIPVSVGSDGSISFDTSSVGSSNIFMQGAAAFTNALSNAQAGRFDLGTGTGAGVLDWGYDPTYFPGVAPSGGVLTEVMAYGQALLSGQYSWIITPALLSTLGAAITGKFTARNAGLDISLVPSSMTSLSQVYEAFTSVRRMGYVHNGTKHNVRQIAGSKITIPGLDLPPADVATFGSGASWRLYARGSVVPGPIPMWAKLLDIPGLTIDYQEAGLQVSVEEEADNSLGFFFKVPENALVQIAVQLEIDSAWTGLTTTNLTLSGMNMANMTSFATLTSLSGGSGNNVYRTRAVAVNASAPEDTIGFYLPSLPSFSVTTAGTLRAEISIDVVTPKITRVTNPVFTRKRRLDELLEGSPEDEESEGPFHVIPHSTGQRTAQLDDFSDTSEGRVSFSSRHAPATSTSGPTTLGNALSNLNVPLRYQSLVL